MTASASLTKSRHVREALGVLVTLAALVVAVASALAAGSAPTQLEFRESAASSFLAQLASGLPFGYAFAAGMVAAVNTCGFALLSGYLGLYLGTERGLDGLPRRLLRAAGIALVVSTSFVVLFGAAGAVVAATSSGIARYFPLIGLAVGVALVVAGGAALAGRGLHLTWSDRLGDRAGDTARWAASSDTPRTGSPTRRALSAARCRSS
jgi:cytochrome c biogenesis protein CcdA